MNEEEEEKEKERSRKIHLFIEQVLKPIFPNARFGRGGYFGAPGGEYYRSEVETQSTHDIFSESIYDISVGADKTKIIHYTTLENAINIINSRAIRLYDLNYSDDPQEYYIAKILDKQLSTTSKEYKSHIYYSSFCEYNEDTQPDSFDMWRTYGRGGAGIAVVFSIDNTNSNRWLHFHLAKIQYHTNDLDNIVTQYIDRHKKFIQKHGFTVTNISNVIYKVMALHKNVIWESENEVRLMHYQDYSMNRPSAESQRNRYYKTINREYQLSSYYELPLFTDEYYSQMREQFGDKLITMATDLYPKITIDKIIFGNKFNNNAEYTIGEIINDLSVEMLGYRIKCEMSRYKKFFD